MSDKAFVPLLVAMMLLTGVCNTLLTKYQDIQCIADCNTTHPKHFEQPVIQTLQMFIGESGCWLVVLLTYLTTRLRTTNPSSSTAAYRPIGEEDSATAEEEEEEQLLHSDLASSQTLVDPTNVIVKPVIDGEAVPGQIPLTGWKITLLAIPAVCDIVGTTLMNAGLLFVAASIYQMTRGALVLFVGLFSVLFLKRRLSGWKWGSLFLVVSGVAIVGLAGVIGNKDGSPKVPGDVEAEAGHSILSRAGGMMKRALANKELHTAAQSILGVSMTATAQIFAAVQFVTEERIMEKYSMDPIQVVGWEGTFGFLVTLVGMAVMHLVYGQTPQGQGGFFDARTAFAEVFSNRIVAITSLLIMISIGGFNFFGLSVTRHLSATARSTIDTTRTLFIWLISLGLGWESFKWLQLLGFSLVVLATGWFNDVIPIPKTAFSRRRHRYVSLDHEA